MISSWKIRSLWLDLFNAFNYRLAIQQGELIVSDSLVKLYAQGRIIVTPTAYV